jgi:hypothetical protein
MICLYSDSGIDVENNNDCSMVPISNSTLIRDETASNRSDIIYDMSHENLQCMICLGTFPIVITFTFPSNQAIADALIFFAATVEYSLAACSAASSA